jgi:hypothetical protein
MASAIRFKDSFLRKFYTGFMEKFFKKQDVIHIFIFSYHCCPTQSLEEKFSSHLFLTTVLPKLEILEDANEKKISIYHFISLSLVF